MAHLDDINDPIKDGGSPTGFFIVVSVCLSVKSSTAINKTFPGHKW